MPDLMTTFAFGLEVQGVDIASFRKCSGLSSETEVIEYKEATPKGVLMIRKVPAAMKWGDVEFERRIDTSGALWEWRKQVIDGDIDTARREASIRILDSQHNEIARWNLHQAWPSKYTGADLDAGANDVASEKLTLTHEGMERAS